MTTAELDEVPAAGDRPRALIVDLSLAWGGAQASLGDWLEATPASWRCGALAIVANARLGERLEALGIAVRLVSLRGRWQRSLPGLGRWLLDVRMVRRQMRRELAGREVVYVNGILSASPWILPGFSEVPLVVHWRDVRGSRWLAGRVAAKATATIAISEFQAKRLAGRWADDRGRRLQIIGNGVKAIEAAERSAARRLLKLPEAGKVVGLAADFVGWKRHERLLGALALGSDWNGLLAGDYRDEKGEVLRGSLVALAERLGVDSRVQFAGHVSMAEVLGAVDVLVSLADDEPFGRTVVEAMQAGIPVVAMRGGGPAELLAGYDGAVLCGPEPAAIAAALKQAMAMRATAVVDGWRPAACADSVLRVLGEAAAGS